MSELFDTTTTAEPSPTKRPKLLCLMTEHAKEKYGLPPTWEAFRYECFPPGGPKVLYVQLTGNVPPPPFKSGLRKGRTAWAKRDKKTDTVAILPDDEHQAWLAAWEAKTGLCRVCQGSGLESAGWSQETGPRYRACVRCGGTGKADLVDVRVRTVTEEVTREVVEEVPVGRQEVRP